MRVLPGSGRSEKKEVADRTSGTRHPGQKHLVNVYDLIDRLILTDDALVQIA